MPCVLKILWNIRNFLLNTPDFFKLCLEFVVVGVVRWGFFVEFFSLLELKLDISWSLSSEEHCKVGIWSSGNALFLFP